MPKFVCGCATIGDVHADPLCEDGKRIHGALFERPRSPEAWQEYIDHFYPLDKQATEKKNTVVPLRCVHCEAESQFWGRCPTGCRVCLECHRKGGCPDVEVPESSVHAAGG